MLIIKTLVSSKEDRDQSHCLEKLIPVVYCFVGQECVSHTIYDFLSLLRDVCIRNQSLCSID
jgi:hypothetical protein